MKTENNYRSNPNHKQYERRPATAGRPVLASRSSKPSTPSGEGYRGADARPSTG